MLSKISEQKVTQKTKNKKYNNEKILFKHMKKLELAYTCVYIYLTDLPLRRRTIVRSYRFRKRTNYRQNQTKTKIIINKYNNTLINLRGNINLNAYLYKKIT